MAFLNRSMFEKMRDYKQIKIMADSSSEGIVDTMNVVMGEQSYLQTVSNGKQVPDLHMVNVEIETGKQVENDANNQDEAKEFVETKVQEPSEKQKRSQAGINRHVSRDEKILLAMIPLMMLVLPILGLSIICFAVCGLWNGLIASSIATLIWVGMCQEIAKRDDIPINPQALKYIVCVALPIILIGFVVKLIMR